MKTKKFNLVICMIIFLIAISFASARNPPPENCEEMGYEEDECYGFGEFIDTPTTIYNYDDYNNKIVMTTRRNSNSFFNPLYYFFDGIGRVIQTQQKVDENTAITTNTKYLDLSLVDKKSKLYFDDFTGNYLQPDWVDYQVYFYTYDGLGRVLKEDLTLVDDWPGWYGITWNEYGPSYVITFNSKGEKKKYAFDNFGRTVRVDEQNPGTLEFGDYATGIRYDALGNTIEVIDSAGKSSANTFDYLKRLIRSNHPDTGENTFEYDDNGNPIKKTDARNTIYSVYDSLNRLRGVSVT